MLISLGADHGGYDLKEIIKKHLEEKGYEVEDVGTFSKDSCDYPILARKAAELVANKTAEFGIIVCTSGEGVCMTANKVSGVRAGLAYNDEVAALMRQHNNANVMTLGAKFVSVEDALKRVDIFLSTNFEGGRHERRVNQIEK